LQAFFERIARQSATSPPASRALRQVYQTAGQPPPDFAFFIARTNGSNGGEGAAAGECGASPL